MYLYGNVYSVEVVYKTNGKQGSVFGKPYGLALFFRLESVCACMCLCVPTETMFPTNCVCTVWIWECFGRVPNPPTIAAQSHNSNSSSGSANADTGLSMVFHLLVFSLSRSLLRSFCVCAGVQRMCVYVCWCDVYRNAPCVAGARRAWKIHFLKSAVSLCCYFHTCASVSCVLWTEQRVNKYGDEKHFAFTRLDRKTKKKCKKTAHLEINFLWRQLNNQLPSHPVDFIAPYWFHTIFVHFSVTSCHSYFGLFPMWTQNKTKSKNIPKNNEKQFNKILRAAIEILFDRRDIWMVHVKSIGNSIRD